MIPSIHLLASFCLGLAAVASAQYDPAIVGTWSSKSKKVITGPVRGRLAQHPWRVLVLTDDIAEFLQSRHRQIDRTRIDWNILLLYD